MNQSELDEHNKMVTEKFFEQLQKEIDEEQKDSN
jgi:hypothetical protein